MRKFTTVRRDPSEWCEQFQSVIDDQTPEFAGKPITVDLDTEMKDPVCGGRSWYILSGGLSDITCEHVIVIGD